MEDKGKQERTGKMHENLGNSPVPSQTPASPGESLGGPVEGKVSHRLSRRSFLAGLAALAAAPIAAALGDKLTNKTAQAAPEETTQPASKGQAFRGHEAGTKVAEADPTPYDAGRGPAKVLNSPPLAPPPAPESASQGETLQSQEAGPQEAPESKPKEILITKEFTNYKIIGRFTVCSDGKLLGIMERNDNQSWNLFTGQLDPTTGNLDLKIKKERLNFTRLSYTSTEPKIAVSETDSGLIVVAGPEKFLVFRNGILGPSQEFPIPQVSAGGYGTDVQISPDNGYIFIPEYAGGGGQTKMLIFKLATNDPAEYTIPFPTGPAANTWGKIIEDMNKPTLIQPNLYKAYARLSNHTGYIKLTFSPATVEGERMKIDQSFSSGIINFFDSQQSKIWNNSNNTTLYETTNDAQTAEIRPTPSLYPEAPGPNDVSIISTAPDSVTDKGFLGVSVTVWQNDWDFYKNSAIECFSRANPGDMNQRVRLPEDGDFLKTQTIDERVYPVHLHIIQRNGKTILLLTQEKYISGTFSESRTIARDITNSVNDPNKPWKIVPVTLQYYSVFLPLTPQTSNAGW